MGTFELASTIFAIHAWTDYPAIGLVDKPGVQTPMRPCALVASNDHKSLTIVVDGIQTTIPVAYCYLCPGVGGLLAERIPMPRRLLDRLPKTVWTASDRSGYPEGATCCITCRSMGIAYDAGDGEQSGSCWGKYHWLVPPPIVWRKRRGKAVQVPATWVGKHTTPKTIRDRKSAAKAKKRTVKDARGHVVSKASMRAEGKRPR